jgi:hypothetical protein
MFPPLRYVVRSDDPVRIAALINHQLANCQTDTGLACSLGATVLRWWWMALFPLCALLATGVALIAAPVVATEAKTDVIRAARKIRDS